jgi:putative oxidoreductase
MEKLEGQSDIVLLIGRLLYSSPFVLYGFLRLINYAGTVGYLKGLGLPAAALVAILVIIAELGGGLLMLIGFQTRAVALSLAFYLFLVAIVRIIHFYDTTHLTLFMKNMAIVGGALAFFECGAGAYSLDGFVRRAAILANRT